MIEVLDEKRRPIDERTNPAEIFGNIRTYRIRLDPNQVRPLSRTQTSSNSCTHNEAAFTGLEWCSIRLTLRRAVPSKSTSPSTW